METGYTGVLSFGSKQKEIMEDPLQVHSKRVHYEMKPATMHVG